MADDKIVPFGTKWGAKAVAADALDRVKNDDAVICLWMDGDMNVSWSKTELSPAQYAVLSEVLSTMSKKAWEQDFFED